MTARPMWAPALLALAMAASGCSMLGLGPNVEARAKEVPQGALKAPLLPPAGKTLVIIGQRADSAEHEPEGLGEPGGVMMSVTFTPDLEQRLSDELRPGADSAAGRHPQSALQIALRLVDTLDRINQGVLDREIDTLIGILAASRRPTYLRFGPEFDGEWNHYEVQPYRAAWLRFRQHLVASGAKNIAMVWHSSASCGGNYGGLPFKAWYPGDAAVDWIGLSWYQQASCDYGAARRIVDFARERRKPLMIAESAPRGFDLVALRQSKNGKQFESRSAFSIWRAWFDPYFAFVKANDDVVRAISYVADDWEANRRGFGYAGNSQLDGDSGIARRWSSEMNGNRWLRGGPNLAGQLLR